MMEMHKPVIIKRCHLLKINKNTAIAQISLRDILRAGIDIGKNGTLVRVEIYIEDERPSIDLVPAEIEIIERIEFLEMNRRVEIYMSDWYYKRELTEKMVTRFIDEFIYKLNEFYNNNVKDSNDERDIEWLFSPKGFGPIYARIKFIKDPTGWKKPKIRWAGYQG